MRSLLMTAGWFFLVACGARNEDLFAGTVSPPVEETQIVEPVTMAPLDPSLDPPMQDPPPVMETPPAVNETPNQELPVVPTLPPQVVPPPPVTMEQPTTPPEEMPPEGPRIVSVSPEDGARGVSNDVSIVITFSVPMNQQQTEAAYQSEGIPSGSVSFSWNDDSTELTITPNDPLTYPSGTDPDDVASNPINYFVSASAADEEGNNLASPAEFSFTLLRQINLSLSAQQNRDLTGTWRSNDTYGAGNCARSQETVCVGDTGANQEQYKGFITFDLGALPTSMSRLESARLNLQISARPGNPFNGLGGLLLDHITFTEIGPAAFDANPLAEMGTIATQGNTGTVIQANVRNAVATDVGSRARAQFRLEFGTPTNNDGDADTLISLWDTQRMDVSYLIP